MYSIRYTIIGVDWRAFVNKIKEYNAREARVFCPIQKTMKPWIDINLLSKFYPAESAAAKGYCTIS